MFTFKTAELVRVRFAVYNQRVPAFLLQLQNTWLYRAYRKGPQYKSIIVERSLDAGTTWPLRKTLSSTAFRDGGEDTETDDGSAPVLACDRWDGLYALFHDDTTTSRIYRSDNFGETWTLHASHAGQHFPTAAFLTDRMVVAAFNGNNLRIHTSDDFGVTLTLTATEVDVPIQRVSLHTDHRDGAKDLLHLVYQDDGGAIVYQYSSDGGDTWSARVVMVAAGSYPSHVTGHPFGLLAYYVGDALHLARTDETQGGGLVSLAPPTFSPNRTWPGLLQDHRGSAWFSARETGAEVRAQWLTGSLLWADPG